MVLTMLLAVILVLNIRPVHSLNVTGSIATDTFFYYRKLTLNPSKLVEIDYVITYNYNATVYDQCDACHPVLDIYTDENDNNLLSNCSRDGYGQLRNENLNTPLKPNRLYRFTICNFTQRNRRKVRCVGNVTIQDFIPRLLGFSLGYYCYARNITSLKGATYTFHIYNQSNLTACFSLPDKAVDLGCSNHYSHTSLPNLIGDPDWNYMKHWMIHIEPVSYVLFSMDSKEICYQFIREVLCYTLFPKCDSISKQVIHSCRELCEEFIDACNNTFLLTLSTLFSKHKALERMFTKKKKSLYDEADCGYLPSRFGEIPCFYKSVTCQYPPNVTSAVVEGQLQENYTFHAMSQVDYSCTDERYEMEGNSTATCQYSGNWSESPICVKKQKLSTNPLYLVLFLLLPFVIFLTIILVRYYHRRKRISKTRKQNFDAFVCYSYDEERDREFAEITLRIHLEEKRPFKLCIHRRDFLAGWDTMWNIRNAIKNSNSAIIVMSQNFVDSAWCREEFDQCYFQHMNDAAFKLFVIMMQPVNTLPKESQTQYMETFFEQKTYLEREDPKLFKKIAEYLTQVKTDRKAKKRRTIETAEDGNEQENIELMEVYCGALL